jgi:hypothetical protein
VLKKLGSIQLWDLKHPKLYSVRVQLMDGEAHFTPAGFSLNGKIVKVRGLDRHPFALTGGTGAIWIRATEQPGTIVLRAKHPRLGTQQIEINVAATAPEHV